MRKTPLLLLMLLTGTHAFAQPAPRTLDARYTLSFWDIGFGHIQYSDTLKGDAYAAQAHFETQGMVGFFWKSVIDATANGSVNAAGALPAVYDSHSRYRDHPLQRVKLTYADGIPSVFFDPPIDPIRFPVPKDQQKGAIDPMSALISVLVGAGAASTPCGADAKVFDGRRRYDVRFTYLRDEKLDLGGRQGSGHLCELHFVPIAGYPQRLIMERRDPPKMFADFVDAAETGAPTGHYVVPVKVWAELSLGTVTATLDSLTLDGEIPAFMTAEN
jgi:hypothetical protein